jgi:hypothetical protein
MKLTWELPPQEGMVSLVSARKLTDVLLEYEGPQLMILEDLNQRYIALAVDCDDTAVRWIQSPISILEFEALVRGGLSVRDALLKSRMLLADYTYDNRAVRVWEITQASVPEDALPEPGALLPSAVRNNLVKRLHQEEQPEFHIDSAGHDTIGITFTRLSVIMSKLQALWNSIARRHNASRFTLSAEAVVPGSSRIKVHVDDRDLFEKIAASYRDLVFATFGGRDSLSEVLSKIDVGVGFAYEDFLKAIDFNEVEVLAEWARGAVYVGYEGAQRTRGLVRATLQGEAPVLKETASLRGYMVGYTRKIPRFEFYDLDSGELIAGKVTRKQTTKLPFDAEIVLGRSRLYQIRVEIARQADEPPKYTLLEFDPAGTSAA